MLLHLPRGAGGELAAGEVEELLPELFVGHRVALLAEPSASGPTPSASSFARSASRA